MAKKKSQYTRYREAIRRQIASYRKKGYQTTLELPPTEHQLRQQGVRGRDLAKATSQLKNQLSDLRDNAEIFDPNNGEILTGKQLKQQEREQRKLEKENERRFWSGEEQLPVPDGGAIIYDNTHELLYEGLVAELSSSTLEYDTSGGSKWAKKYFARKPEAKMASENARQLVLQALEEEAAKRGKSSVGWSIQQNVKEESIDLMLYGYDDSVVTRGLNELLSAIRSRPLTQEEQKDLSDTSELDEDWEEY